MYLSTQLIESCDFMSNEIYNEGRVVGYSAEELFDRLFHEKFPNEDPPTTKEWLSTSMGMGASFALHINKKTTSRTVVSYTLPKGNSAIGNNLHGLSGRYLILATPIFGTPTVDNPTAQISAVTNFSGINTQMSSSKSLDISGYSKILNGIIVYTKLSTTIKLLIDGACTCDILLTGFLNSKILEVLKLATGTTYVGSKYTDIAEFGNNLTPNVSQIFFARPNYVGSVSANVIDTDDTQGNFVDISQVANTTSTQSTSNSIITPTNIHYKNKCGNDSTTAVPNVLSVQQHTNGNTKINLSLYFYNPATKKLEPIDSDAKGAVNIVKRDVSKSETEAQLKSRIMDMTNANADKVFLGAWVESSTPTKIEYLILPGKDGHVEELGDLLTTLKTSGEGQVRLYATKPNTVDTNYINYGFWD